MAQAAQARTRKAAPKQQELKFADFAAVQGMETREQRDAISPGLWSWLMNFQPIGRRTLRAMNGKATTLYTLAGDTILNGRTYIIGTTYYAVLFTSLGAAYQINLTSGAATTIGTAGTFWSGSGQFPHAVDFGNSGLLIVSPLGYWAWDGTTLFAAGSAAPSWLTGQSGSFTLDGTATNGSPNVTNVPSTAGLIAGMVITGVAGFAANDFVASFTATGFAVESVPSAAPDNFTGTTGPFVFTFSPLHIVAKPTNGSNVITFIGNVPVDIVAGMSAVAVGFAAGTTVTGEPSATTLTLSNNYTGTDTYLAFTFAWDMPTGISGTAIEIYNGSPWIVNGRTILASAPGNGADFAVSDGAVSLTVQDSYVQDGYSGLKQLDGFLYLFAHGAVDVISDVQTSGSPPTTTFLRVNVSPKIGTPWRDTIVSLPSSIAFSNTTGVYEVAGGQARKISDPFDGVFEKATYPVASTDPSGYHASACVTTQNKVICYALTISMPDPDDINQVYVPCLAMWDGQRWFLASQEVSPLVIFEQDNDSNLVAWASDATHFYQAFQQASGTLAKKAKSWFTFGNLGSRGTSNWSASTRNLPRRSAPSTTNSITSFSTWPCRLISTRPTCLSP